MSLEEYKRKRRFDKTTEPLGKIKQTGKNIFVIQKHKASNLHYDFRIENNGVLKSWAIPKGPSTNPSQRRLAVETEDHPIDYATFEGVIPKGEYGGGTVIVWDLGTYHNKTQKEGTQISIQKAHQKGHITLVLHGQRLKGEYALIKTKRKNQWLLIKKNDSEANKKIDITEKYQNSVLSDKSLEEMEKSQKNSE